MREVLGSMLGGELELFCVFNLVDRSSLIVEKSRGSGNVRLRKGKECR